MTKKQKQLLLILAQLTLDELPLITETDSRNRKDLIEAIYLVENE